MSKSRDRIGHLLDGRIKLTGILGSGAYGVVYSGINIETGHRLAIKSLPKQFVANWQGQTTGPAQALGINCFASSQPDDLPCTPPQRSLKRFHGDDDHDNDDDLPVIHARSVPLNDIVERFERAMKQHKSFAVSVSKLTPSELACREIALHAKVHSHPSILTIYEVLESNDCLYMVLQHFERGDLFHAITETKMFIHQDINIRNIFMQLVDAVAYCHSRGVYHCDLKPENILISDDGKTIQLADFGLATNQSFCTDFGYGSSFYMAPERLLKDHESRNGNGNISTSLPLTLDCKTSRVFSASSSDVWALGIILLNLCCGRNPWKKASLMDDASFRAFTKDWSFLEKIMPITSQLNDILRKVFDLNSTKRLTVTDFRKLILNCPMVRPRLNKSVSCPGLSNSQSSHLSQPGFQTRYHGVSPILFVQPKTPATPATSILPQSPWLYDGVFSSSLSSTSATAATAATVATAALVTSSSSSSSHISTPTQNHMVQMPKSIFFSPTPTPSFQPWLTPGPQQLLPPLPLHSTAGLSYAYEDGERDGLGHGLLSPPTSEIAPSVPVTPEQQVKPPASGYNNCHRSSKRARTSRVAMTPL